MKIENHKIARLVTTTRFYDQNIEFKEKEIRKGFNNFIDKIYQKKHFEFLVFAGGTLFTIWPPKIKENLSIEVLEKKHIDKFTDWAMGELYGFFNIITEEYQQKLKKCADYLTIGVDVKHLETGQHIELVAVVELINGSVQWTGKFYPTEGQKKNLVKLNDLRSHFIKLNNQNVAILGCHDLMVYSPRGQAMVKPDGWKAEVSSNFKLQCSKFKPDIVLQHPHSTDHPSIWNQSWKTLEKELPSVKHYASGIFYPKDHNPRASLEKVLEKTKKGDVLDYILI